MPPAPFLTFNYAERSWHARTETWSRIAVVATGIVGGLLQRLSKKRAKK